MASSNQLQSHKIFFRQKHRGMKDNTPLLMIKINNNTDWLR